jgi:hypothetical protein
LGSSVGAWMLPKSLPPTSAAMAMSPEPVPIAQFRLRDVFVLLGCFLATICPG